MNTTDGYIKNDAADAATRIDRYLSFKDVRDDDMLAERAYEELERHCAAEKFYRLELTGPNTVLTPGSTLRVVYHRWVDAYHAVNVDADLIILSVKNRVDADGYRTVSLECGTIDRHPETDASAIVGGMGQSGNFYTHPQPIAGADVTGTVTPAGHAASHGVGQADAVTLASSQISDLIDTAGTLLTISGGVISTGGKKIEYHKVETESGAATDDLDTINGANNGDVLILRPTNGAHTVVVKHATGNIRLDGSVDFSMDSSLDTIVLLYAATLWVELSRSNNGT
jgi:hypothetical protein